MYGRPPQQPWQTNPNNPNMAPVPPRHRGGIGAAGAAGPPPPGAYAGPPPGAPEGPSGGPGFHHQHQHQHQHPHPGAALQARPPPFTGPPPGYGTPPSAAAPPPPSGPSGSNATPAGVGVDPSTTVFVGSITPGISDLMLRQLLTTCGTLVNLKRISPAFGFASFDHPEAVMRAIELLNGLALPPPGVTDASESDAKAKKLNVKADEKTRAFVEQYKANRASRASAEEDLDNSGRAQIQAFVAQLKSPDALSMFADSSTANSTAVPAHLKDLPPEDVPEEHRSSVLGEIDKFRQASAAREEEKRRRERVLERERLQAMQQQQQQQQQGHTHGHPRGPARAEINGSGPQSFNNGAPGFVRGQAEAAAKSLEDMDPEEADELEHTRREEAKAKDDERKAQESLAAYTHRERARLTHWARVLDEEQAEEQRRQKIKSQLLQRSAEWDDEAERKRELFWVDRPRWRHFRGPMLRREMDEDEAGARADEEEARRVQLETEKFLARQEEEMRKHLEEQRKAGVLVDGTSMQPLKLKMGAGAGAGSSAMEASGSSDQMPGSGSGSGSGGGAAAAAVAAAGAPPLALGSGVLGDEDDDDASGAGGRSKGAAIRVDLDDGLTAEQRREAVQAKRAEIQQALSGLGGAELFARQVKWEWVDEDAIRRVYAPLVAAAVADAVGEPVPELVDVMLDLLRNHQRAEKIQEAVEPIMDEDAQTFAEQMWKMVIEESLVASSGLTAR